MGKESTSINLIKKDKNVLENQIVNWALTIGRTLVIIVEIVALAAFIYRFTLDNQLRDINSAIKRDQAFLLTQRQKETTYRNLQDRLLLEKEIVDQGKEKEQVFNDIIALTPQGINFSNINLSNNSVNIQLNTPSVFPLSVFVNSLKNYPLTDSISLNSIDNHSSSALIDVGLTVNLKNKGGTNINVNN
jgi:hypothetical protein